MNRVKLFRFNKTRLLMSRYIDHQERILDLGTPSDLSEILKKDHFNIQNAYGFDFDLDPDRVNDYEYDVLTAFEVLEHLVSPFPLLQKTRARKLVVTVPLRLWFAKAYQDAGNPWDRHYHEFESWQLDMLVEKAGWEIRAREKWVPPFSPDGLRSILRAMTPRFYAVYAERTTERQPVK